MVTKLLRLLWNINFKLTVVKQTEVCQVLLTGPCQYWQVLCILCVNYLTEDFKGHWLSSEIVGSKKISSFRYFSISQVKWRRGNKTKFLICLVAKSEYVLYFIRLFVWFKDLAIILTTLFKTVNLFHLCSKFWKAKTFVLSKEISHMNPLIYLYLK